MPAFGDRLARPAGATEPVDLVHAHFWMSGLAAPAGRPCARPCRCCRRSTRWARSSGATRARRTPARRPHRPRAPAVPRGRPRHRHVHRRGRRAAGARAARRPRQRHPVRGRHRRLHGRWPRRARGDRARGCWSSAGWSRARASATASRRSPSCPASSWWSPADRRRRALDADPEVDRLRPLAAAPRRRGPGRFLGGVAAPTCRPWCAAATSWSPCRGTSRSASSRWRRWPAAGRWSASAVGGLLDTVVPGVTGELVPPRRPDRLAPGAGRRLLADPGAAGATARPARAARRRDATSGDRVVAAAPRTSTASVCSAAPPRPGTGDGT